MKKQGNTFANNHLANSLADNQQSNNQQANHHAAYVQGGRQTEFSAQQERAPINAQMPGVFAGL